MKIKCLFLGQSGICIDRNAANFSIWFLQLIACILTALIVASHVTETDSSLTEPNALIKLSDFGAAIEITEPKASQ